MRSETVDRARKVSPGAEHVDESLWSLEDVVHRGEALGGQHSARDAGTRGMRGDHEGRHGAVRTAKAGRLRRGETDGGPHPLLIEVEEPSERGRRTDRPSEAG